MRNAGIPHPYVVTIVQFFKKNCSHRFNKPGSFASGVAGIYQYFIELIFYLIFAFRNLYSG